MYFLLLIIYNIAYFSSCCCKKAPIIFIRDAMPVERSEPTVGTRCVFGAHYFIADVIGCVGIEMQTKMRVIVGACLHLIVLLAFGRFWLNGGLGLCC